MVERRASADVALIERLRDAINQQDLDAFTACFAPGYRSEQPLHPADGYEGRDAVRKSWAAVFQNVPDIRADLIRCVVDQQTAWTEWDWSGTWQNGTAFHVRGVIIFGLASDLIQWGRLYMEPVQPVADSRSDLRAESDD